jgi:hypothetical protein
VHFNKKLHSMVVIMGGFFKRYKAWADFLDKDDPASNPFAIRPTFQQAVAVPVAF